MEFDKFIVVLTNLYNKPGKVNVNPFVPNAPFLYPLKISENRKVFCCFQEVEKRCIENKWVKVRNRKI